MIILTGLLVILLLNVVEAEDLPYVWWEGEYPTETNFPERTWFSPSPEEALLLSGGDWLTNADKRTGPEAFARYEIQVPADDIYRFWTRKFWKHGPFRWRFDEEPWQICSRDVVLEDSVSLRRHVGVNWVYLRSVELSEGNHTFELRLLARPGENLTACFDAFFLTRDDRFIPAGKQVYQPPEEAGPADWFPVTFYEDPLDPNSVIDISSLVEAPAGRYGFVQRRGENLVFSERPDRPVKFWGCGANYLQMNPFAMTQRARYLRKHGINMVRQHPLEPVIGLLHEDGTFDPDRLDRWDRWFATLREQGIYVTLSLFYPHHIQRSEGYDLYEELPKAAGWVGAMGFDARSTSGLVSIEPALQESEWRWEKAFLLHRNPYTGLRYVDDPALAVVEIHNEDSIFWHAPLNDLATGEKFPQHTARLKRRWTEWLRERYGDDERLREAWGDGMRPSDSVGATNMEIYAAWQMTAEGPRVGQRVRIEERRRMGDFIRFLAETQRRFYEDRQQRLRELGFQGVTLTTAWRAGGAAADPANLWSDDAMSMIDRHNYFGGGAGGHSIAVGKVNNGTHLGQPGSHLLSIGFYQVEDKPFSVTEWTQLPPNEWKLEAAPLFAFYGMGLQGWDASYHFLNSRNRLGNGWPGLRSYVTDTPHYIGQFPALAFALYQGHIEEAPLAAARRLSPDAIFQGIDALNQDFTGGGYDAKELQGNLATPIEVLAIGRVTFKVGDGLEPSAKVDWDRYWDRTEKRIRSMTGELIWDYGQRVVEIRTEKTQGIVGFAGGQSYDLPGIQVLVNTPFVSLLFTPLDNAPLVESKQILITAMARDRQADALYNEDGTELRDPGHMPLLMEPVQATIRLKGPPPALVNVLDVYGVPTGKQVELESDGSFAIDGTYTAYYYEVKRAAPVSR